MKKKLTAVGLGLAAVGLLAFGAPNGHAADACNTTTSQHRTNGTPDGTDTITTSPADGAAIYAELAIRRLAQAS